MNEVLHPALIAIIAATALVSFKGFGDPSFFRKYEFHIGSVRAGEQYRMVTSGFLHADIAHLAFNMITLYFFAPVVIEVLNPFWFLLIYLGSLLTGSLLTLFFHKDDYSYRAIGASGAVTGILYSAILFSPFGTIYFFFIPMPALLFGVLYLAMTIWGMKSRHGNIGHAAHFGGAVGGYVLTLARVPELLADRPLVVAVLAVPIVVLFVLARLKKI